MREQREECQQNQQSRLHRGSQRLKQKPRSLHGDRLIIVIYSGYTQTARTAHQPRQFHVKGIFVRETREWQGEWKGRDKRKKESEEGGFSLFIWKMM